MTSLLLMLACEVAPPPPPPTPATDLDAICKAVYAVDWEGSEEAWDASLEAAVLHTPEGEELRRLLVEDEARNAPSIKALTEAIAETGADQSSIDCALVAGFAPTLEPPDPDQGG